MTTDGEYEGWKESGAGGSVLSATLVRLENYAPPYTPGPGSPSPAVSLDAPPEPVAVVWQRGGYAVLLSGG